MGFRIAAVLLAALALTPAAPARADGASARTMYMRALERERSVRDADRKPTLIQLRGVVNAYDAVVRRFPSSGYADNALWQGGNLAILVYERFGQDADKRTAVRLLDQLRAGYPSSSLVARVDDSLRQLDDVAPAALTSRAAPVRPALEVERPATLPPSEPAQHESPGQIAPATPGVVAIRDIKRTAIAGGMRVTIEMDGESTYHAETLERPRRVFFDLKGARPIVSLLDATITFDENLVREIRLGRHPQNTTRIVMDMEGADSYSVFTLYNPFRLVIDFKASAASSSSGSGSRGAATADARVPGPALRIADAEPRHPGSEPRIPNPDPKAANRESRLPNPDPRATPLVPSLGTPPAAPAAPAAPSVQAPMGPAADVPGEIIVKPLASRPVTSAPGMPPALPAANADGNFSLARQLGLGVSRIVIDAGHGGHDPGAHGNGINEADLVLDVATRLAKLVQKQTTIEVVMTRDTDVFIPLEERTAIANRQGADLFLSIHANASRSPKAHGVETYFLNFASNTDAEAVAARENSGSARTMHSLPDIVRAIALNNKIDESRDFAEMVQRSMVRRLATRNKQLKDLGVKQAPFVVLIGAAMPSVLAEISFVTHKQEGTLLKSGAYRQQIAEALLDAILRYQQSLKKMRGAVTIGQK